MSCIGAPSARGKIDGCPAHNRRSPIPGSYRPRARDALL